MLGQMAEARFTQASYCLQPQVCLLLYRYSVHLIPTTTQHLLKHSGLCVVVCRSMHVYAVYPPVCFVLLVYESM